MTWKAPNKTKYIERLGKSRVNQSRCQTHGNKIPAAVGQAKGTLASLVSGGVPFDTAAEN